jgi:hypothetical protein
MRHACAGEWFYRKKEGRRYCVLHYPGDEKAADFKTALDKKQSARDYNFNGVWFPKGVKFKELHLDGSANFSSASFNDYIDFSDVEFRIKALFNDASFNAGVDFSRANFTADADFSGVRFGADAKFIEARFCRNADFRDATFSGDADFKEASFTGNADFFKASFGLSINFSNAMFVSDAKFAATIFSGDVNFSSVRFSAKVEFNVASFSAPANFNGARFTADADFFFASFSARTDFLYAIFFAPANFSAANFNDAADFSFATFSADAQFSKARFFDAAIFIGTIFKDLFHFEGSTKKRSFGDQQQLNFQTAQFEKPDRVSFHKLDLRPHWFVNVDSRRFVFHDVEFRFKLKKELKSLNDVFLGVHYRQLEIACRQLALNAEENHRYRQAADLRYAAMDTHRLEWLQDRETNKRFDFLHWLYWMTSGYGEKIIRAVMMLGLLWLVFAFFYTKVGFEQKTNKPGNDQQSIPAQEDVVGKPLPLKKVLTYSLGVMSLQKPDPKPVTVAAQTLVIFETILGPIQAALLALAIRRRFMR